MAFQKEAIWRRVDEHGEERCLFACTEVCVLQGIGVLAFNGSGMMFEYRLDCAADCATQTAAIIAKVGNDEHRLLLERSESGWSINGTHEALYDSCTDIDLSFSPSTNTLAIRHLALEVGQEGSSRALHVAEPTLALSVLEQRYRRLTDRTYEYQAGDLTTVLDVDAEGLVLAYPGMFETLGTAVVG